MKFRMCVLLLALTISVQAKNEMLNLFGSVGFGFGMGGELATSTERASLLGSPTKVEDKFFNYGNGLKFDLGVQYFMMENVALQPSISYSAGIPSFEIVNTTGTSTTTFTENFQLLGIKLAVVPRFEILDLLDLYTGVGLSLNISGRSFEKTVSFTNGTQSEKGKISAAPALGLLGMLGGDFPLSDNLSLFVECAFEQMHFNLDKYEITSTNITGSEEGKSYYSKDDANNLDPQKTPGSNVQIRFGIRFGIM